MNITRIVILERLGHTDEVYLHTDFPATFPTDVDPSPMTAVFQTRRGLARSYVSDNFPGLGVEIIDGDTGERTVWND